jgi:hypothetical protein
MALYVTTFFTVSLPSAFLGIVLFKLMGFFVDSTPWRVFLVITYGLGTIAFPYSQTLNGRQIAAVLTIVSFYILVQIKKGSLSDRYLFPVGTAMGLSAISDYPSALILIGLFIYSLIFLSNWRLVSRIIIGGIPPVVLLILYNLACFGTPLPVGYKYSVLYQDLHSEGLISITYPKIDAIYGLSFSPYRGLFYSSPILIFALVGFYLWYKAKEHRGEFLVCLWAVLSTFLFYSSSSMWWGGYAVGPAYLTAMMPFMIIPLAFVVRLISDCDWRFLMIMILGFYSISMVWIQTIAGQSFPDLTTNPLMDKSIPALKAGNIARNLGTIINLKGFLSLFPLAIIQVILVLGISIRAPLNTKEIFSRTNRN